MRLGISPAGGVFWGALYLLLSGREFLSLLAAAAAHELGHIAALVLLRARVEAVCLTGSGLRIDYARELTRGGEIAAALSGPAAGMLWCAAANMLGAGLSAQLSLVLTLFNLLPLSPLDGGRALRAAAGDGVSRVFDALLCTAAMAAGLWCASLGIGAGGAVAAGWLCIYTLFSTCKSRRDGIK